ncbi:MAG TPA: serine/threonine-protein kinase, partial [Candidatus Dormibacteraeota bacterium]
MSIEPGTTLGAYEVHEFLGQGAMGTVYRAYHAGLARPAAVKVLQALAPDPDATVRFRREAQAIAQMRHPNVLNVYDFGEFEGTPYMIVEYMPGGSLSDRLKAGERFDRSTTLRLLEGIAAALDYAHGLDIVHRDVKPANVLLDGIGSPVLADFGLAKLLQSTSVKTVSGVTTGTPAYMSPEQVMGSAVGPPADTYALTTMAYEFLAGAIPFEGEGMLELLYAHVHREPPAASTRNPDLSAAVDAVLARGLAKDPTARWPTGSEMVAALRAALSSEAAPAVEATLALPPAAVATPSAAMEPATATPAAALE